jgi:tripartite-type tricarboxylate transporter receptor subunit TctC
MDHTRINIKTRRALGMIFVFTVLSVSFVLTSDAAPAFPSRPITFYVPFSAGGAIDLMVRPVAGAASRILQQPVVVSNKPGGAATLAPTMLKTMKPDGYNICCGMNNILFLPLQQEVAFDPLKDFTYICTVTDSILGIAVRSTSGWKTAKDFIAYAKANPGKIKYANSAGAGTPQHMAMSEVALKEGIKWELVPYVGGVQSFAALLGGHVQAAYGNIINITSYLKSGELTLLWVLAETRSKLYPDVPTLKELGFFSYSGPVGIIGPSGMPKDLVSLLDETFRKTLSDPEAEKTLKNIGAETCYMNSTDYRKWATESYARYSDIIKQLGLEKK